MLRWILPGYDRQVPTYQPPRLQQQSGRFLRPGELCPGDAHELADVLAVLEAEAPADATAARPGKIDDRARRLIERARGAGWQTATIADPHRQDALDGRFRRHGPLPI